MSQIEIINLLSILVLGGFLVALLMLIALLWRANRLMAKLDHFQGTVRQLVSEIVPAIINFGAIATSVEAIVRKLIDLPRPNALQSKKPRKN